MRERIIRLGDSTKAIHLSVLTPFHKDDPTRLLTRMRNAPAGVEFILLDDGSGSAALLSNVVGAALKLGAPATIIVRERNCGRAEARNRLVAEARGEYVLLLDADMLPDEPDFLQRWLHTASISAPNAAFGGLSLRHAKSTPATALHHHLFDRSDCRRAIDRARSPAQHTASANLLVRRDFLLANPFDRGFVGWGFEDTEWALRASAHSPIVHIDNPATHIGLDDVETLLRKAKQAGPNFARLSQIHPAASRFAAYRVARALRRLPLKQALRAASAGLARQLHAPLTVRRIALKLYRASCFAEHLA